MGQKYIVNRVPTGIEGFDELVEGGFPENSVILLAGTPGTGKSIFSLEYIYNGAISGDAGVYITFEQTINDLKEQALQFRWDFENLDDRVKLKEIVALSMEDVMKTINKLVKEIGAKRLVIDSFTGMLALLSVHEFIEADMLAGRGGNVGIAPPTRGVLKNKVWTIFKQFKDLNCTTLIPIEIPVGTDRLTDDGVTEFLSDGVVVLRSSPMGIMGKRTLTIHKMRKTRVDPAPRGFDFTESGIVVMKK